MTSTYGLSMENKRSKVASPRKALKRRSACYQRIVVITICLAIPFLCDVLNVIQNNQGMFYYVTCSNVMRNNSCYNVLKFMYNCYFDPNLSRGAH